MSRTPASRYAGAADIGMKASSMPFDSRSARLAPNALAGVSLACVLACPLTRGQEIDTALYQSDRRDYSLLDQVDDPAERKAISSILAADSPAERLQRAETFVSSYPASWHRGRVLALASRAALRTGRYAAAARHGEESLRLWPENALLLIPMAAIYEAIGKPAAATAAARQALIALDRFARPATVSAVEWGRLETQLRSMARTLSGSLDNRSENRIEIDPALSFAGVGAPRASARYAGSESCRKCHSSQHANWSKTGMARMLRPYKPGNVFGDFTKGEFREDNGTTIGLVRNDQGHFFDMPDAGGGRLRLPVDYTIGSKWQQAYATKLSDGRMQVFPIQYNRLVGRWLNYWRLIDPPRSRRAELASFHELERATNYQVHCAPCHTSQLAISPPQSERPADIHFREGGVNCEMCHGPSAAHAEHYSSGRAVAKTASNPPVDFRRIGQDQYTRICAQCHMQSAMFKRGADGELNHSGDAITFFQNLRSRPFSEFSKKAFYKDGRFRETTFVVESLMRSKCYQEGGVTCGHCHDPHGRDAADNPKSLKFRDEPNLMCLQCHSLEGPALAAHTLHAVDSTGSDCASCHMPKIMNSLLFKAGTHRIDDVPSAEWTARFGSQESPNACLSCHSDETVDWLRASLARWAAPAPPRTGDVPTEISDGLSEPLERLLAHIDEATRPDGLAFLVEAGNWTELADRAASLLEASPNDPELHYWLGIAHSQSDLIKAVQAFRRAEDLGLATPALRTALGLTYYNLSQFALFAEQMEKAIAADPTDARPYHYLGRYYERQLNNFPKALEYFEQALERDPSDVRSLYFKGYCLQTLDRREEAIRAYARAAEAVRDSREAFGWPYQKLAETLAGDQPEKAVDYARLAVELEPEVADHRLVLGKLYEQVGELEASVAERKAAAALRPSDPAIPYVLMRLYQRLGREDEAAAALRHHERLRQIYGAPE